VRVVDRKLATLLLEELRLTNTGEPGFAGRPAESTVSTNTVPLAPGLMSCEPGTGMILSLLASPLGLTVVTCAEIAFSPTDDAEIDVEPGVVLLVKFATAKPEPFKIVTLSVTEPTPARDDVRKTTVSLRARGPFRTCLEARRLRQDSFPRRRAASVGLL